MAVTKIIRVKDNVKGCIKYVTNKDKTDDGTLVSYSGCHENSADYVFKLALDANHKNIEAEHFIKAYHIIQSFAPTDEVGEAQAHEIGMELVKRMFGGKYAFICGTHTDRGHLHNHIVVCAANMDMTGGKIDICNALQHKLQRTSDDLCRENGLSVIDKKKGRGKHYKEWLEDMQNPNGSKKTQLRKLIDEQIKLSKDFDDFIAHMKEAGAGISYGNSKKYGRVTKYRLPNATEKDRWNRGYNLGDGYSDEMIAKRIARRLQILEERETLRLEREEKRKAEKAAMTKADKEINRTKLKINHMIDTSGTDISSSNIKLQQWKNLQDARFAEKLKSELREKHGIDYTDIKAKINSLEAENNRKTSDIARNNKTISNMRLFIENSKIYMETYKTSQNYEKSKNQERYYQEHDSVLNAYAHAVEMLKRAGMKLSILEDKKKGQGFIKDMQEELKKLEELNSIHEQDIKNNQKEIAELRRIQKELDIYHGRSNDTIS